MKTERKHWVALATLLIIFSGVAAASSYGLTLDPAAPVEGSSLYVTVSRDGIPEPGVVVQFVLNSGLPIINLTDAQGKARFKPLAGGTIQIYATTQDGTPLANGQYTVSEITITPTPTKSRTSSSGGSGGGSTGGSGIVSSEPLDNIVRAETRDGNLMAGKPVKYSFSSPEHGIYEIVITGKDNEYNIPVRVEALKGLSKRLSTSASSKKYINIIAGTNKFQEAFIRFRVEHTWLASEGISEGDVRMLKWDGSSWIELDTKKLATDSTYTSYEAYTTTFSHFAVGSIGAAPVTAVEQPGAVATSATGKSTAADAAKETGAPATSLYWILYVLIAVVVVAVIYFVIRKSK